MVAWFVSDGRHPALASLGGLGAVVGEVVPQLRPVHQQQLRVAHVREEVLVLGPQPHAVQVELLEDVLGDVLLQVVLLAGGLPPLLLGLDPGADLEEGLLQQLELLLAAAGLVGVPLERHLAEHLHHVLHPRHRAHLREAELLQHALDLGVRDTHHPHCLLPPTLTMLTPSSR